VKVSVFHLQTTVMTQLASNSPNMIAGIGNKLIRRVARTGSKGSDHFGNSQNRLPQPALDKLPAESPVGPSSCYSGHSGRAVTEVTEHCDGMCFQP